MPETEEGQPAEPNGIGQEPAEPVDFAPPTGSDEAIARYPVSEAAVAGDVPASVDSPLPKEPSDGPAMDGLSDVDAGEGSPAATMGAHSHAPAPPPAHVPSAGKRVPVGLIAVAVVVVVALIVWAAVAGSRNVPEASPSPSPSPSPTQSSDWSRPIPVDLANATYLDLSMEGTVVAVTASGSGTTFTGISLTSHKVAWTISGGFTQDFFGDSTGLAILWPDPAPVSPGTDLPRHILQIIDPVTGDTIAQTKVAHYLRLLWAGHGMVLTAGYSGDTMCAMKMQKLSTCLWKADSSFTPSTPADIGPMAQDVVFAGKWVNTNGAVLNLATGKRAAFGHDTGAGEFGLDPQVFYAGPSADRVYRVVYDDRQATASYQPWDVSKNVAVSPATLAGQSQRIHVLAGSSTYMTWDCFSGDCSVTAHEWLTGKQVWQQPWSEFGYFIGSDYVLMSPPPNVKQAPDYALAMDDQTGEQVWQGPDYGQLIGLMNNVVYLSQKVSQANDDGTYSHHATVIAYDATSNFSELWTSQLPDDACQPTDCRFQVIAGAVIAVDESGMWVLNR